MLRVEKNLFGAKVFHSGKLIIINLDSAGRHIINDSTNYCYTD